MEKKLTAMQVVIEKIEKQMSLMPDDATVYQRGLYDAYFNTLNWAKGELVNEKQQIIDTHFIATKGMFNYVAKKLGLENNEETKKDIENFKTTDAEQYYSQTFKTD